MGENMSYQVGDFAMKLAQQEAEARRRKRNVTVLLAAFLVFLTVILHA